MKQKVKVALGNVRQGRKFHMSVDGQVGKPAWVALRFMGEVLDHLNAERVVPCLHEATHAITKQTGDTQVYLEIDVPDMNEDGSQVVKDVPRGTVFTLVKDDGIQFKVTEGEERYKVDKRTGKALTVCYRVDSGSITHFEKETRIYVVEYGPEVISTHPDMQRATSDDRHTLYRLKRGQSFSFSKNGAVYYLAREGLRYASNNGANAGKLRAFPMEMQNKKAKFFNPYSKVYMVGLDEPVAAAPTEIADDRVKLCHLSKGDKFQRVKNGRVFMLSRSHDRHYNDAEAGAIRVQALDENYKWHFGFNTYEMVYRVENNSDEDIEFGRNHALGHALNQDDEKVEAETAQELAADEWDLMKLKIKKMNERIMKLEGDL